MAHYGPNEAPPMPVRLYTTCVPLHHVTQLEKHIRQL